MSVSCGNSFVAGVLAGFYSERGMPLGETLQAHSTIPLNDIVQPARGQFLHARFTGNSWHFNLVQTAKADANNATDADSIKRATAGEKRDAAGACN
jgi:hypothetical protein